MLLPVYSEQAAREQFHFEIALTADSVSVVRANEE